MNAATTAENMISPNDANAVGTAYLSTVSVDMVMFLNFTAKWLDPNDPAYNII